MTNQVDNLVQLTDKYGDKISNVLSQLAEKLGMAGEHFWPVFVRQQMISGYSFLLVGIVFVLIFSAIFYRLRNCFKELSRENFIFLPIIIVIFVIFILFLLDNFVIENISKIINPEYYAIKEVIGLIK